MGARNSIFYSRLQSVDRRGGPGTGLGSGSGDDERAPPGRPEIDIFLALKRQLSAHLERPTFFLFHSEQPLSKELREYVTSHGLWYSDRDRLKDL